jgi:N-formylglutamate deformylase
MCDVDRFVDKIYGPGVESLKVPFIVAEWHRYVVDLNRLPDDIDEDSVVGAPHPSGQFPIGLHWSVTTQGHQLIPEPMSYELHETLVKKYFEPFHQRVREQFLFFKEKGFKKVYHLDAHSMPSLGTAKHRDPGERRAEIVVSDVDGVSCEARYKDIVIEAYKEAGFQVAYNWPYKGGRVTQTYGHPELGQHTLQVEMNRELYMDESSKHLRSDLFPEVSRKVSVALERIYKELSSEKSL